MQHCLLRLFKPFLKCTQLQTLIVNHEGASPIEISWKHLIKKGIFNNVEDSGSEDEEW